MLNHTDPPRAAWAILVTPEGSKQVKCERCDEQRIPGRRFCKACEKAVLKEMAENHYLTPKQYGRAYRGNDSRENVQETKYGRD